MMRDAEGRIVYDAGPPCDFLGAPWQHAPAGELGCGKPKGHGGRHEHHVEPDGRSAYRKGRTVRHADGTESYHQGGLLDVNIVQIGPLGEH